MTAPDWMAEAACRDLPTDLFFPADKDDAGAERAKAVCRSCPVRRPCVAYALADPSLTGVWGASRSRARQPPPSGHTPRWLADRYGPGLGAPWRSLGLPAPRTAG